MRHPIVEDVPGLAGFLEHELTPRDGLPARFSDRDACDLLERRMAAETTDALWSIVYLLYRNRRPAALVAVAAEIVRRGDAS